MGDVLEAFLAGLPAPARAVFDEARTATLAQLEAHTAAARAAWPDLAIATDDFAGELGARLGKAATPEVLAECHAADVYLAIACSRGDENAIRAFDATYLRSAARTAMRHTRASAEQADEVTAVLRLLLFIDEPPRKAACRTFSGRSTLKHYVTIIATRELVDMIQQGNRATPLEDDEILSSVIPASDPELSLLRNRYRDEVDASFRSALGKLSERSRAVLRFRLLRKWPVGRIATIYGKAEKTIYGWIDQAREELRDLVRAEVAQRLKVQPSEVDSIVRLVQSRIEVSFDRLESATP